MGKVIPFPFYTEFDQWVAWAIENGISLVAYHLKKGDRQAFVLNSPKNAEQKEEFKREFEGWDIVKEVDLRKERNGREEI